MKYQKATVTVINLGNEDILTCSGYNTGCIPTIPTCQTGHGFTQQHTHTGHNNFNPWKYIFWWL